MRTTLTLDDDVAANLKADRAAPAGPSARSSTRRCAAGWRAGTTTAKREAFKIVVRDLGDLRPGLSLDDVAGLIEQVEGALHR